MSAFGNLVETRPSYISGNSSKGGRMTGLLSNENIENMRNGTILSEESSQNTINKSVMKKNNR